MTVYTTLPTDDENLEVTVIDDPDLVTLNINPAQVTGSGGTTGTVERVDTGTGLTGGPITTTGTVSIDETSDVTFNTVTATNEFIGDLDGTVRFAGRNVTGATIAKGQVIYISGISGNTPEVSLAKADSSTTMPAFGIAIEDILNNASGQFATFGSQTGLNVLDFGETGITFQLGDTLYISHTEAGHITNVAPPNENCLIQNIGKIERATPTTNMTIKVGGAGRSNATPNLNDGNIFLGNASNQSVTASLDTSVSALGYITNSALTPYYTSSQVDALPVSTFSNDAGYSTTTGTVTPSSTDTFTNKSGSNSQWTNDENYTTNSGVDLHLNTSVANPNDFLKWDGVDYTWQGLSTVAISNSYIDLDDLPTLTTINNNGDNRIITRSNTASTLEGETDFTWDGSNAVIDGSSAGLTNSILHLKTDNSGWNRPQLMCTDSNGDVFSQVGQLNTTWGNFYQWNITLDPNNTHGRTGVTTQGGEYYVSFEKNFSDQADISMDMTVYGAHKGFNITVRDDGNSYGGNQYKGRPLNLNALETNINCGLERDVLALSVKEESIDCKVPIGQARLSSDPANPVGGWTYYNTTTNKLRLYVDGGTPGWVDLN